MVSINFEPGDRVRVVKGDEEDLPVGFETTVTATSVEEYGVEAGTQFLDLLDAAGDPRCRPAHEFELVPQSATSRGDYLGTAHSALVARVVALETQLRRVREVLGND